MWTQSSPLTPHAEGWYHEHPLRLEQASPEKILELLEFSVMDLVKTVLIVCVPDAQIPAVFLDADAMQKFLESLSVAEERERAMAYEARGTGSDGVNPTEGD